MNRVKSFLEKRHAVNDRKCRGHFFSESGEAHIHNWGDINGPVSLIKEKKKVENCNSWKKKRNYKDNVVQLIVQPHQKNFFFFSLHVSG